MSARSADDYRASTQALLPRGLLWPRDPTSTLGRFLKGWAEEMARLDARSHILLEEIDPRTTSEAMVDFERVLGLPDPCRPLLGTLPERRNAIIGKLLETGGQSIPYFIAVAARYGYTITIEEFRAFTVEDTCDGEVMGDEWAFVWRIHSYEVSISWLTTDGTCADPLRWWGNEGLECPLRALKPAHTVLLFAYDLPPPEEEDWGFVALAPDAPDEDWGYVADAADEEVDFGP